MLFILYPLDGMLADSIAFKPWNGDIFPVVVRETLTACYAIPHCCLEQQRNGSLYQPQVLGLVVVQRLPLVLAQDEPLPLEDFLELPELLWLAERHRDAFEPQVALCLVLVLLLLVVLEEPRQAPLVVVEDCRPCVRGVQIHQHFVHVP